jgi:hypothetical protein
MSRPRGNKKIRGRRSKSRQNGGKKVRRKMRKKEVMAWRLLIWRSDSRRIQFSQILENPKKKARSLQLQLTSRR